MKNPANETPIASVTAWTPWRAFTTETNQQSVPVYLQGGQRYYLEALMDQVAGDDNLTVQWELPDGTVETPLATGSAAGRQRCLNCSVQQFHCAVRLSSPASRLLARPTVFRW